MSPKSGVYVLPYMEECVEALRWLANEIEQEKGRVLLMQVDCFENMPHEKVVEIFRRERLNDYKDIEHCLAKLEQMIQVAKEQNEVNGDKVLAFRRDIKKIRKNIDNVSRVDFFPSFDKRKLLDRLYGLQQRLVIGNLIFMFIFSSGIPNTVDLSELTEESSYLDNVEVDRLKRSNGSFRHVL
ncbi:MAG: hypothetical protein K2X01_10495 [Cyanobacteria bacterium]|nr:hypothetical protein [Cyanobacteriota bacterium]